MKQMFKAVTYEQVNEATGRFNPLSSSFTVYKPDICEEGLMDHAWYGNPYCDAVCQRIYRSPVRMFWVGSFADVNIHCGEVSAITALAYVSAWSGFGRNEEDPCDYGYNDFSLDGKFIVNYDKKLFVDCDNYYRNNKVNGQCINPLPLLTAVGNNVLGDEEDYHGTNYSLVGSWAGDMISIINVPNRVSFSEIIPSFNDRIHDPEER